VKYFLHEAKAGSATGKQPLTAAKMSTRCVSCCCGSGASLSWNTQRDCGRFAVLIVADLAIWPWPKSEEMAQACA